MDEDRPGGIRPQQRATNEVGTRDLKPLFEPGVIKAFVAGVVLGNMNMGVLAGFTVGALVGTYIQQNFPGSVPDIGRVWEDVKRRWGSSRGGKA